MKKYTISAFVFVLLTNFSYAHDISSIIFEEAQSIDDIIISNQVYYEQKKEYNISSSTKYEIDAIIQKAIDDANKKEVERKKNEDEKIKLSKEDQEKTISKSNDIKSENINKNEITKYAKSLLDVPYVWGGNTTKGFDCSGFVKAVFDKFQINIARTTYEQIKQGKLVDIENIQENDLIFFDTRSISLLQKNTNTNTNRLEDIIIIENEITNKKLYPTMPTHVGIYIGNGNFIHASSSKKKTVIEKLDSSYFKNRIIEVRRYI